jgi:hypothetical protein
MIGIPFRSAGWLLGLLAARPSAPDEARKRAVAGGGGQPGAAPFPGAFAVDLSRMAMAAPLEE